MLKKSKDLKLKGRDGKREISTILLKAKAVILPFKAVRSFIGVSGQEFLLPWKKLLSPLTTWKAWRKRASFGFASSVRNVIYFRPWLRTSEAVSQSKPAGVVLVDHVWRREPGWGSLSHPRCLWRPRSGVNYHQRCAWIWEKATWRGPKLMRSELKNKQCR